MKNFLFFRKIVFLVLLSVMFFFASAKSGFEKIYLWRGVKGMELDIRDTILYLPNEKQRSFNPKDNRKTAVVICPGGSYHHLGLPHEGFATAKWFLEEGAIPFVLQYRVAYNEHHYPAMLEDIQMAIRYIRQNAEVFGINPAKVGAIGFSAGGHLVTMAAEFDRNELEKLGVQSKVSLRPNFVIPIYPVVSMQDNIAHQWSRKSLLGHQWKNAKKGFSLWGHRYTQEMKNEFSMELNVPDDMVPVYILACKDDPVVMFENSVRLDAALTEKNIPHRFAVYETGGHGFGMKDGDFLRRTGWNRDLRQWLSELGFL